jgi:peptidyl-prolyl cis-trans isomerase C
MLHIRRLSLASVLALFVLTGCTRPAENGDKAADAKSTTVATVNGKAITTEMLEVLAQATTGKPLSEATPEQKDQMTEQLINVALAAQEAERSGEAKTPEMRARLDLLQMQLLSQSASEKFNETNAVTDDELAAEYDARVAALPKEYRVRHILVEQKDVAESLIRDLKGGGNFAKLAATESKDPVSAPNGGELDWSTLNNMLEPFANAVKALEVGAVTPEPVQTRFGWHVIQLEEVRAPQAPDFEAVKDRVKALVQQKKFQTHLDEVRKTSKVQKS